MDLNKRFFWGILLVFSILLLQGCLPESSDPSYSDFTSNRIPVALPDTIDVDVYRIEITSDSTELLFITKNREVMSSISACHQTS